MPLRVTTLCEGLVAVVDIIKPVVIPVLTCVPETLLPLVGGVTRVRPHRPLQGLISDIVVFLPIGFGRTFNRNLQKVLFWVREGSRKLVARHDCKFENVVANLSISNSKNLSLELCFYSLQTICNFVYFGMSLEKRSTTHIV